MDNNQDFTKFATTQITTLCEKVGLETVKEIIDIKDQMVLRFKFLSNAEKSTAARDLLAMSIPQNYVCTTDIDNEIQNIQRDPSAALIEKFPGKRGEGADLKKELATISTNTMQGWIKVPNTTPSPTNNPEQLQKIALGQGK